MNVNRNRAWVCTYISSLQEICTALRAIALLDDEYVAYLENYPTRQVPQPQDVPGGGVQQLYQAGPKVVTSQFLRFSLYR